MRLPPLALLSIPFIPLVASHQLPFSLNTTSVSIVDVLSQDPDYESLLHLLQRAKLIPTLNKLNGSTFFAPTNKAIRHASFLSNDNIQHALRQRLFYHLVNYNLPDEDDHDLQVLDTLYFPEIPLEPPSHDPPPSPPWLPIPGGSLGGASQRLRLLKRDRVGVDAFGKGGVSISKDAVHAANGIVMGIDRVIEVPPNLAEVVRSRPELSYLSRILDPLPSVNQLLNSTPALTLFLPVDKAWEALHPLERLYLESEFAADDLQKILRMHAATAKVEEDALQPDRVIYSELFDPGINLTTLSSTKLSIRTENDKTIIGKSAELIQPDIYASNGVLHLVSSLLINPDSLKLTTEKFLLALNCTRFISLLHSVNLEGLVNGTEKYTVLAIRDDVLALYDRDNESAFGDDTPGPGSKKLERMLRYHFIRGKWTPDTLTNGLLLETALIEEEGLSGAKQVIKVGLEEEDKSKGSIKFGGAGVVGEYLQLPNTTTAVYFLSRPLTPPSSVLQTALPRLHLSTFLAVLSSLPVPEHPPSIPLSAYPRTTYMIPHNEAFGAVGTLVKEWLLGDFEDSKADLERVVRHHIIDGVVYADKLTARGRKTYRTLEGSDVEVVGDVSAVKEPRDDKDRTTTMTPSGGWSGMQATIYAEDLLTETGVIHEVSDLLIPRSVVISIGKLVKASGGTTMATLIVKAGMGWVLTGEDPPDEFLGIHPQKDHIPWTLLCPSDAAFSKHNLTELYANPELMQEIVKQHLIATPPRSQQSLSTSQSTNRPLVMDDDATYSTALSSAATRGDVTFKLIDGPDGNAGQYVVGIKDARGTDGKADWAKVISWGRTTPGTEASKNHTTPGNDTVISTFIPGAHTVWFGNGGGGVISIDRVLLPYHPSWVEAWGKQALAGIIGVMAICGFFWSVNVFWRKDLTEATYEPVGGFGRGDEEDED